jgi:hypothetical protein
MQASKVSQLILEYGFWIVGFDEFGSVWSEFNHVLGLLRLLFEIWHQSNAGRRSFFWEFEHFEHPVRNVAYT